MPFCLAFFRSVERTPSTQPQPEDFCLLYGGSATTNHQNEFGRNTVGLHVNGSDRALLFWLVPDRLQPGSNQIDRRDADPCPNRDSYDVIEQQHEPPTEDKPHSVRNSPFAATGMEDRSVYNPPSDHVTENAPEKSDQPHNHCQFPLAVSLATWPHVST